MRKAALLFVTSSRWGGWHHVEVHKDDWWIRKYELYGFKYDAALTSQVRTWAKEDSNRGTAPNGEKFLPQHIILSMKVFVNPAVAALPEHAHLFPEHGCLKTWTPEKGPEGRPCSAAKGESEIDPSFFPLKLTPQMDEDWDQHIKKYLIKAEDKKV